ncbi:MAG: hypothetical protein VCC99_06310 [Alphaproteobacteria bacterium]
MSQRRRTVTELELQGYRLTTAEILYRLPDHHTLLQTYVWQNYDLAPRYPVLERFLAYWRRELDGPLHSVRIASAPVFQPRSVRHARHLLTIQ